LQEVNGNPGNLEVILKKHPRYVNPDKCTGCGVCLDACPIRYEVQLPEEEAQARTAYAAATEEAAVVEIIDRHRLEPGNLLPILLDINRHFNWLPRPSLEHVALELKTPLTEILRVASFYNAFSLVPRGRHIINVCLGTGCFVKGSPRLLDQLERKLGITHGQTTADMLFTLEVVRCIGCCALAPAVRVGEDTFGRVTPGQVSKIIDAYAQMAAS
jgi:NADH:ubiquinone oxidoreductase subunit E